MHKLGAASKRNLQGVNTLLIAIIERGLQISPVDFGIPLTGGVRTTEQQLEMYEQGLSGLDGNIKKSKHQSGNAFDFFAYVDGTHNYDPVNMSIVACAIFQAASELGIEVKWGGLWSNPDMPHFEYVELC